VAEAGDLRGLAQPAEGRPPSMKAISGFSGISVTAGVRIVPGLTAFTVMRLGASSIAPRRVRWTTAAFDAP
jgi:hypothetical protein